jgi:hypothetical protein
MSSTPNNPYLVKSMNGTITISDGMGVIIENGTIIAKEFDTNTIKPSNPNDTCNIWENCASDTHYSKSSTGTVNLAINSKANVNIGPTAGNISDGNINIATSTALTGNILIGSTTATNTLKLQTPKTECNTFSVGTIQQLPTSTTLQIGNNATTYAFIKTIQGLIIGNNPSTGFLGQGMSFLTSNSGVGSMIMNFYSSALGSLADAYISVVGGTTSLTQGDMTIVARDIAIQSSGTLTMGSLTTNPIGLQTNDRVVMGLNPSTYNTTTGTITGPAVIVGANGSGPYNAFIDFYSYAGTAMGNAARIIANSGGLSISNYLASTPLTLSSVSTIVLSATNNVDIQDLRFVGGQLYPKTSQTLYLGNANCPTIAIGSGASVTSNVNIGVSGTTTTTISGAGYNYIQNSIATIVGTNPTSHNPIYGTLQGTAIRLYNNSTESSVDMYSANGTDAKPSSRIVSTGGSNLADSGTLDIIANIIRIAPVTNLYLGSSSSQQPVTVYGPTYFTNNNINTTRSDYASFGGTQISWNRTGGNGETNLISYQGPGNNGGFTLANMNTAGTYQELMTLRSSTATLQGLSFTGVDIQPTSAALTANLFTSQTATLNIGGETVNIKGPNNNLCVYGTYKHEFGTGSGLAWHDFHSLTAANTNNYDGAITCAGGTVGTDGRGQMYYNAAYHQFTGGISYGKGNLTNTGYYQQNGSTTMTTVLGAGNAMTPVYQSFPVTFASVPNLQLTTFTTNVPAAMGCISSFHSVTASGFYICFYNARSTNAAANAYGVHWTATGGY